MKKLISLLLFVCVFVLLTGCSGNDKADTKNGIIASCVYGDGYLLLSSDGKVTKYNTLGSPEGEVFKSEDTFCDMAVFDGRVLLITAAGKLFLSDNNFSFQEFDSVKNNYTSCCSSDIGFIAACSDGKVVKIDLGQEKTVEKEYETGFDTAVLSVSFLEGKIAAISSKGACVIGDKTLFHNMSEFYPGDYELSDVTSTDTGFAICGVQTDKNIGVVFTSDNGEVWSMRTLNYFENELKVLDPPLKMYDIVFDGEQLVAACNQGRVVTIPSCVKCNKITEFGDSDIYTVCSNGKSVITGGSKNSVYAFATDKIRQNNISVETAKDYLKNGGILIDVRDKDEFDGGHIEGAVNIPLSSFEKDLTALVENKDTYLVFYCTLGVRSANAVVKAKDLGFKNSFSVGAMSNWSE